MSTGAVMLDVKEGISDRLSIVILIGGIILAVIVVAFVWDRFVESRVFSAMQGIVRRFGPFAVAAGLIVALGGWVLGGGGEDNVLLFRGLGVAFVAGIATLLAYG